MTRGATHFVEDVEILTQGVSARSNRAIVGDFDGVIERVEVSDVGKRRHVEVGSRRTDVWRCE